MSTLAVNSITDTTGLLPPTFPAGSAQLNPMAGREDKIINGDMNIWQRGTSFTTNVYGADRWYNNLFGGTVTQSQQAFTLGDTLGVTSPAFYLRQSVSGQTLTTHFANTFQAIEGVRSYAGQTVTVLGWARRSTGTGNMVVEGEQYFGAGGSPSATVAAISPTTVGLGVTGTWTPFAAVITVPSVTGKTLGTDGRDRLNIAFWTSAGSSFNARTNSLGLQTIGVDLWGIHIRQGTWTAAATADYRPRDPGTELALCQRYFRINPSLQGAMNTANEHFVCQDFRQNMRTGTGAVSIRSASQKLHQPGIRITDITGLVAGTVGYFNIASSIAFGANVSGQLLLNALQADDEL